MYPISCSRHHHCPHLWYHIQGSLPASGAVPASTRSTRFYWQSLHGQVAAFASSVYRHMAVCNMASESDASVMLCLSCVCLSCSCLSCLCLSCLCLSCLCLSCLCHRHNLLSTNCYQLLISECLQPTCDCPHMCNCQDARWQMLATCRQSPDGYSETTSDSLADTEAFIKWVQQLQDDKIHAVVTPRFVPTCTPELLRGLGQLAAHFNTPIQSHISESFDEVHFTVSAIPGPWKLLSPMVIALCLSTTR